VPPVVTTTFKSVCFPRFVRTFTRLKGRLSRGDDTEDLDVR
jgi:hypothetical protein